MKKIYFTLITFFLFAFQSCNLLDIKPVNSMLPVSVEDFESVLLGGYPRQEFFMRTDLGTDNVYANLNSGRDADKNLVPWFVWAATTQLADEEDSYWRQLYQSIFYCNTVLDEFEGKTPDADDKELFETVRGEAYALRAYCYFYLINLYADVYSEANLGKPGVPMPLSAEDVHKFTQNNVRESIGKVYEQIEKDLNAATADLTGKIAKSLFRFGYTSLQALKARVYLFMGRYEDAIEAASDVIASNSLFDMNNLQALLDEKGEVYAFSGNSGFIDTEYKNEVLFFVGGNAINNIFYYSTNTFKPSEELLNLCLRDPEVKDYRKYIFSSFANLSTSDGIQTGPTVYYMFAQQEKKCYYIGFKLSEAYVIRAESYARLGQLSKAIDDLNDLLVTRMEAGKFTPLQESDFTAETLLKRILEERRIELAFDGGLRWFDLRRLGKPALTHVYENGLIYELKENDPRYILQIPQSEQENSPGMELNPRN